MRIGVHAQDKELLEYVCCVLNEGDTMRRLMRQAGIAETKADKEHSFLVTLHSSREEVLVMGHRGEFRGLNSSLLGKEETGGRGELVARVMATCFTIRDPAALPPEYTKKLPQAVADLVVEEAELMREEIGYQVYGMPWC